MLIFRRKYPDYSIYFYSVCEYNKYTPTYVICHCSCKLGLVSNRDICETVN